MQTFFTHPDPFDKKRQIPENGFCGKGEHDHQKDADARHLAHCKQLMQENSAEDQPGDIENKDRPFGLGKGVADLDQDHKADDR